MIGNTQMPVRQSTARVDVAATIRALIDGETRRSEAPQKTGCRRPVPGRGLSACRRQAAAAWPVSERWRNSLYYSPPWQEISGNRCGLAHGRRKR
jgi:hypothetical protein